MSLLETLTFAGSHADEARDWLTRVPAADFLFGAVMVDTIEDVAEETDEEAEAEESEEKTTHQVWVRPQRFGVRQRQALSSCLAWHPGLYRQMANCTAGVCLKFVTDASQVALAVRFDDEPNGTSAILDELDRSVGRTRVPHDGVGCVVDGEHVGCVLPAPIGRTLPWLQNDPRTSLVAFEIDRDDVGEGGVPTMPLPGLGAVHQVELWLPALRGCEISDLWLDGTFVERAAAQERLLVLGDSIGQGFVSESPDLSWTALFAREHNLELINQSVGGQVAQPTMLEDKPVDLVQTIILELGGNYRWEPCALFEVERDMRAMITSLTRTYPGTEIIALTPFEHDEITSPSHRRSCWKSVNWERLLSKVSSVRMRGTYIEPNVTVVDASKLASMDRGHFADYEHPSLEGHAEIASRLSLTLSNADSERRREVALEVLNQAGLRAVPVAEAVGRDLAEVVYADEGCVLLRGHTGFQMVFGPDHERALRACEFYFKPGYICVFEAGLEEDLSVAMGLNHRTYSHPCIYEGTVPIACDLEGYEIRPLDESFERLVMERYDFPEYLEAGQLRAALREGKYLGAFADDECVGFVGEHPEGSIGMLTVDSDHRSQGIGSALIASKVNSLLEAGCIPWSEVFPQNKVSYALHEKLGFTMLDSRNLCYLDFE